MALTLQQLTQAGERLMQWRRVLLLSHDRPDGDALGSLAAMQAILQGLGRSATAGVYDDVPERYEFLASHAAFSRLPVTAAAGFEAEFDGILILDTCSWSQLEPAAAFLRSTRLPRLIVDHHTTRDDVSSANAETDYLIDASASATCTMLYEWATAMRWPIPEAAAVALFAGIVTDTGWFRFPSTDPRTLNAAAALIATGLRPDIMYARLMDSYSLARMRLLGLTLETMQLVAGGNVAVCHITPEMFARSSTSPADTEDIVNEPLRSREVIASVLLIDTGDGRVRMNLRSKSPEIVGYELDVAAVASSFGGGGHGRAAGARVNAPLSEVMPAIINAMTQAARPTT
jgi:phosphoesterase RecJ-like protein